MALLGFVVIWQGLAEILQDKNSDSFIGGMSAAKVARAR